MEPSPKTRHPPHIPPPPTRGAALLRLPAEWGEGQIRIGYARDTHLVPATVGGRLDTAKRLAKPAAVRGAEARPKASPRGAPGAWSCPSGRLADSNPVPPEEAESIP